MHVGLSCLEARRGSSSDLCRRSPAPCGAAGFVAEFWCAPYLLCAGASIFSTACCTRAPPRTAFECLAANLAGSWLFARVRSSSARDCSGCIHPSSSRLTCASGQVTNGQDGQLHGGVSATTARTQVCLLQLCTRTSRSNPRVRSSYPTPKALPSTRSRPHWACGAPMTVFHPSAHTAHRLLAALVRAGGVVAGGRARPLG